MKGVFSLRSRLTAIILVPLVLVATVVGLWQLQSARTTANDVFDRALLTVALAIANDVAVSGGDALSPETSQLLENSSGGPVFYHVYAPDGVIVAGYATPPVGIPRVEATITRPQTFDAIYQGRDVSGVRLQTRTQVDGFSGIFTTTVWQDRSVRNRFVFDLVLRTLLGLGAVLTSLALIVWFGVRVGLRPLSDLEQAIEQRSSDDLSAIKRAVPEEVTGIVRTLNDLFRQLRSTMDAQSQFIANAAHQLRNPIAGVLSLAEAVERAKSPEDLDSRTKDLLEAARSTSELTQRLLLHERARAIIPEQSFALLDAQDMLQDLARDYARTVPPRISFRTDLNAGGAALMGDAHMLKEAISNLVDNAVAHGGDQLNSVTFGADATGDRLRVWVADDGVGIEQDDLETALTRFAQVGPSDGSGLGLSIAREIAEAHGGQLSLVSMDHGLRAEIELATIAEPVE